MIEVEIIKIIRTITLAEITNTDNILTNMILREAIGLRIMTVNLSLIIIKNKTKVFKKMTKIIREKSKKE